MFHARTRITRQLFFRYSNNMGNGRMFDLYILNYFLTKNWYSASFNWYYFSSPQKKFYRRTCYNCIYKGNVIWNFQKSIKDRQPFTSVRSFHPTHFPGYFAPNWSFCTPVLQLEFVFLRNMHTNEEWIYQSAMNLSLLTLTVFQEFPLILCAPVPLPILYRLYRLHNS
jgi:hypothetical protein